MPMAYLRPSTVPLSTTQNRQSVQQYSLLSPDCCMVQPVAQTLANASAPQDLAFPWAGVPDIGVEKVLVSFTRQAGLCMPTGHQNVRICRVECVKGHRRLAIRMTTMDVCSQSALRPMPPQVLPRFRRCPGTRPSFRRTASRMAALGLGIASAPDAWYVDPEGARDPQCSNRRLPFPGIPEGFA